MVSKGARSLAPGFAPIHAGPLHLHLFTRAGHMSDRRFAWDKKLTRVDYA